MPIGEVSRIVHASWHQADDIFVSCCAGIQRAATVLANNVRATILPPGRWNTLAIDWNMIEGDSIYESARILPIENPSGNRIDANGYLELYSFDVIQRDFNNSFLIEEGAIYINIFDKEIYYGEPPCLYFQSR